jgi:hypothetical protein
MPDGVGFGLAVGIGVLLQAATAITAARAIRLRFMKALNRDERSPARRSAVGLSSAVWAGSDSPQRPFLSMRNDWLKELS